LLDTILLKNKPHKHVLYSQQQRHSLPDCNYAEFKVKLNMLLRAEGYVIYSLYICYDFPGDIK